MVGFDPVPLPQVITGWQRPLWAKSLGRNNVNCGGAPPSGASPAVGPTFSSITVSNGPGVAGSASGQVPTVQAVLAPPEPEPLPPPLPPLVPPEPLPPEPPVAGGPPPS